MILFLVDNNESATIHESITGDLDIMVETKGDFLSRMINPTAYYDTVIVTKSYIEIIGHSKVRNALKALEVFGIYKLVYLSNDDTVDLFTKQMYSKNLSVINLNVERLTYSLLKELEETELGKQFSIDDFTTNNLKVDLQIANNMPSTSTGDISDDFMLINKKSIVRALKNIPVVYEENSLLKDEMIKLENKHNLSLRQIQTYTKLLEERSTDLRVTKTALNNWLEHIMLIEDKVYKAQSEYNKINECKIRSNTFVIYFKELETIECVKYFDTLYSLFEDRGIYVKSLIIDDREHISYEKLGYITIPDRISIKDLIKLRKIVRYSNSKKLLESICSNKYRLEVLMVLDRSYNSSPFLVGKNVSTFYFGTHRDKYKNITLDKSIFVSEFEGDYSDIKPLLLSEYNKDFSNLSYIISHDRYKLTKRISELYTAFKDKNFINIEEVTEDVSNEEDLHFKINTLIDNILKVQSNEWENDEQHEK